MCSLFCCFSSCEDRSARIMREGFIGVHIGAGQHSELRTAIYLEICAQACAGMLTKTILSGKFDRCQAKSGGAKGANARPQQKQVRFLQTHNQGLRKLFLTVSWDLCAQCGTPDRVLVSLQFRKQPMKRSEGHVSSKNPARVQDQGVANGRNYRSKTKELLMGGSTENSVFLTRDH